MQQTVRIAGTPLELSFPRRKNMKDLAISSENYLDVLVSKSAYSIGAVLGDGHMRFIPNYGNGSWYQVELSGMDIEIIERFKNEVFNIFSREYSIFTKTLKSGTKFYTIRTSTKIIHDFFWSITLGKREIPVEIVRSNEKTKRDFVAGLFDTDGTVKFTETWNGSKNAKNPRWQLGFSNTILNIVESLASILASMKVKVGNIQTYERGGYRTIYAIHPNIRSFIDAGFYFHCKRKQQRLIDYLNHVVGSETMYTAPLTQGEDIVQA